MANEDVKYIITLDATGAIKSMKDFDAALWEASDKADKGKKAFGGMAGQVAIGSIAADLAKKAYDKLVGAIGSCIKGAIDAELAEKNLEAALSITGRTVAGNIQHYLDFAEAQMKVTTFDDEQIKSSQALLLQLTRLDQEGMDRAMKGTMGLATTMGIDLHSATMMVTKAMEGNYVALSRVGIRVAENLTGEQKTAALLDQLEKLYGRSTAEVNTFGGAVKQMGNTWGEAKEAIGGAVVKSEGAKELIKTINRIITEMMPEIEQYAKDLAGFISTVAKVIEGTLNAMERLQTKIGGLRSYLSDEEKAWNNVNVVMGGYSTVSRDIIVMMGKQGASAEELRSAAVTLNKAWQDFGGNTVETLKAILAGKYGEKIAAAFKVVGGVGVEVAQKLAPVAGVIDEIGNKTKTLTKEEIDAAKKAREMKDELEKTAKAILDKYHPLEGAMRKVIKEEQDLTKAFKAGVITEAQYRNGMAACEKELRSFGSTVVATAIPAARRMQEVMEKAVASMKEGPGYITKSWGAAAKEWVDKNQEALDQILGAASSVVGQIDAIMQQSTNNKMLLLDKEYQAKLESIKNSLLSEEEKNKAIEGLDAEYDIKRRGLQRKAAESAKGVAIANAIINVAEGITKALSALPPPFNIILAAITAAAGAIQIALIRAQPIPLATGAIFKRPAMLSSAGGNTYEVAEAGEAEIVSSPRRLREAIMGKGTDGTGKPIVIQNHIYIDGREIKLFITKTVRESGGLGLLGPVGKAMA